MKNFPSKYVESNTTTRTLLPEEVWERWTTTQKGHFLRDHSFSGIDIESVVGAKHYKDLPPYFKEEIQKHIKEDRYADGGITDGDYIGKMKRGEGYRYDTIYLPKDLEEEVESFIKNGYYDLVDDGKGRLYLLNKDGEIGKQYEESEKKEIQNIIEKFVVKKTYADGGKVGNKLIKVLVLSDDEKLNLLIKKEKAFNSNRREDWESYLQDAITINYSGKKYYALGYETAGGGRVMDIGEAIETAIKVQRLGRWDVIVRGGVSAAGEKDITKEKYLVMTSPVFPKNMLREMRESIKYANGGGVKGFTYSIGGL